MKRPILIITLGFITGILWGLYCNIVPFVFLFLIFLTLIFKFIKIKSNNKFIKILNIFIYNNIILILLISAVISSTYLIYCNKKYEEVYNTFNNESIVVTVISNKKETEYKYTYKVKLEEYDGINFILRVPKNKNIELEYGDEIKVNGEYLEPEIARNYGGFNYREYLKTQKVYGIFEAEKIEIIESNNLSKIELFSNKIKQKIINKTNKILPEDTKDLFLGILIGYDDNLSEDIQESFRKSNLTHLLAVSGAHIAYIIVGMSFVLSKLNISKKIRSSVTIIFLILFMYITNFTASVVRASIMGIILLISLIVFRKNDMLTTISFSMLLILANNPYKILDIGLLLSYFATIGIIYFSKTRNKEIKEETRILEKIINYLKELILITVYANVFVVPIMIFNFNTISLTFVISNLIAGILIGPITIGGFILAIILLINTKLAYTFSIPYNLLLELLVKSTKIISQIPMAEILVPTPNIILIMFYYIFLLLYIFYKFLKSKYYNRYITRKILNYIYKILELLKNNYKLIFIEVHPEC